MHNSECPVIESYSNQGELLLNCRQIVLFYTAGKCAARDPWHKNSADSLSISSDSHPPSKCSMKVNCTVPQVLVVVLEKLARVAEIFEDNACRVDWPNVWGCLVTAKCRCWRAVGRKWSVFFFFFFFSFFLSFFFGSFGCDVFSWRHERDGSHEVHRKITPSTKLTLKARGSMCSSWRH